MQSVQLLVALALVAAVLIGVLIFLRRRPRPAEPKPAEPTIDMQTEVRDGTTVASVPTPARPEPWYRSRRSTTLLGIVGVLLLAALVSGGYLLYDSMTARSPARFVVLIAPFDDGGDGSTGRNIALALARQLGEQSRGEISVDVLEARPESATAALTLAGAENADLLIWGEAAPGAVLDSPSLRPRIIYTPNGPYAPNGWDGYSGRFVMPRLFAISDQPINGQAVLAPMILALHSYSRGDVDVAFNTMTRLMEDYPELRPTLPRALRGNVLWARGFYGRAAAEYRLALEQPADEQAMLANNLGAILLDSGDPAALTAFAEAVRLLEGRDLGQLRFNLGLLALREQRAGDAALSLEQARNLLPPSAPLELTLAAAYRDSGKLANAHAALRVADGQIDADLANLPPAFRQMYRQRSDAALGEQQALLDLAEALGARGPLVWELDSGAVVNPGELTRIRDMLRAAADTSELEVGRWRQRSAADAAAFPGTGQAATGQAERAELNMLRQRYYQALVDTELVRAQGSRARSVFGGWIAALFGTNSAMAGHVGMLRGLDELRPENPAILAALGRALRIDGQLDAADQTYDRVIGLAAQQPEGYFGKALVALDRGDRPAATTLMGTALERNGAFFPARIWLAQLAEGSGDWAAAIAQRRALAELREAPEDYIALAQDLRKSGPENFAEAEQILLPLMSSNAEAAIELARLYNDAGRPDAAAQAYRSALAVDETSSVAAFELGETLAAQGDLAGAEVALRDALRFDERNVDARLALAELYNGPLNRPADARNEFNVLMRQGLRDVEQYEQIGDAAMAQGDYAVAIPAYERVLADRPDDLRVRAAISRAYMGAGRPDAAAQAARRIIDQTGATGDPAAIALRADAFVMLGDIARQRGDSGGATGAYNQALQINPQLIAGQIGLGHVAISEGKWGVALGYFETAANAPGGADSVDAQFWLGEALLRAGDYQRAAAAYNRALELRPRFPEALLGLAQLRYAQGDTASALETVGRALEQRPAYAEALLFQGKLLQEQGRFDEALAAYNRSISANNRIAETFYRRALLHLRNEDNDEALGDLGRAIALQPNFPEAHYWSGRAYYAQGRLQSAISSYRQAIALNGGYAEAIFYSGLASEDLGQRAEATRAYQTVLQLDPSGEWGVRAQSQLDLMQ